MKQLIGYDGNAMNTLQTSDSAAQEPATGDNIRVRFCPSPTGTPHVGMVRTCLFNWAYARHTGGTFVFRIEDTDAARDSEESFDQIIESLTWLGMDWDEGVGKPGPYGPYRQSERMDIYREVIDKLVAADLAYESFSTNDEVRARRKARGENPNLGYDNYDRHLTDEQKQEFRDQGRKPALRIRMPDEDITFNDLVRGEVTFKAGSIPDFVIVRDNGDPLYTLVNPVDDALMKITHVLRGEDLLSSTPRQIVLYRALMEIGVAERIPEFGHLPYVMGEGNKKLSKRDPKSNLLLHKKRGMIPEGLMNYLALLGWAIAADRDVFTAEELIEKFDIKDVNPNPARFDEKKCLAINADHIRMLDVDDYTNRLAVYLADADVISSPNVDELDEDEARKLTAAAPLAQTRMQVLGEGPDLLRFLFIDGDQVEYQEKPLRKLRDSAPTVLQASIDALSAIDPDKFSAATIKDTLSQAVVAQLEIKPRFAFGPLFVAITGSNVSIPVFDSMEILGKDESLARLQRLNNHLNTAH